MNKAFIFDMDGVLVNSEHSWGRFEGPMFERVLGKKVADQIGSTPGIGIDGVFQRAQAAGSEVSKEEIIRGFDSIFRDVYASSPITPGIDLLANKLLNLGFKLGLVTQSPQSWIDQVVPRLSIKDKLETVISLAERSDLKLKPSPDGFLKAFRVLKADPKKSIVLEDSNLGIQAAKAAGCYTIGFRGNLVDGYEQIGADAYADTMNDVIKLVEQFTQQ